MLKQQLTQCPDPSSKGAELLNPPGWDERCEATVSSSCHCRAVGGHGGDWEPNGSTGIATHLCAPGSLLEKSLHEALQLFPKSPVLLWKQPQALPRLPRQGSMSILLCSSRAFHRWLQPIPTLCGTRSALASSIVVAVAAGSEE